MVGELYQFFNLVHVVFGRTLFNQYRYQFVGKVMTDILTTKEIVKRAIFEIPKGMKKCDFCFYCF